MRRETQPVPVEGVPVDYSDPPFFSEKNGWTGMHTAEDITSEMFRVCPKQPCNCPRCAALREEARLLAERVDLQQAVPLLRELSRACATGDSGRIEAAVNAAVAWYRMHRDSPTLVAALHVHGITTGEGSRR